MRPNPEPYDPGWLLELARNQRPEDGLLREALAACTQKIGECECGCGDPYFVDPESDEWAQERTVELTRKDGVTVLVDVLADGRVGSIEVGDWGCKK